MPTKKRRMRVTRLTVDYPTKHTKDVEKFLRKIRKLEREAAKLNMEFD